MQNRSFFMVGMPESGKTTYVVSLCRSVIYGDKQTLLRLDQAELPNGFDNIEELIMQLEGYERLERTRGGKKYDIDIPFIDKEENNVLLSIPDLSGEFFAHLVCDRRIKKEIGEKLICADEILFFINTDTMLGEKRLDVNEKSTIKLVNESTKLEVLEQNTDKLVDNKLIVEQQSNKTNQSEVVELLQSILYLLNERKKIKFIISAWDKIEKESEYNTLSPEDYIKAKLPLLHQFILSNSEKFDYQIWGVSAQGGDFDNEEDLARLQKEGASNLARIIDGEKQISYDLTKLLCV